MVDNDVCFRGSLLDGPDVNIASWAGLSLTDEENEALWDECDPVRLLRSLEAGWLDEEELEGEGPGQSDIHYVLHANDVEACKTELRVRILQILNA
jgi:hypothetical protein